MVNDYPRSMTGFAARRGSLGAWSWTWDMRAVNARGLDVRLRLPDWIDGLEPLVRKAIGAQVARGNVSVTLRLSRDGAEAGLDLNDATLDRALAVLAEIAARAESIGVALVPASVADIANMKGVVEAGGADDDPAPLLAALSKDINPLIAAFNTMRQAEGAALAEVLADQLNEVARLVTAAQAVDARRTEARAEALKAALARVLDNAEGVDEARLTQELAMLAVKADIREELDRLAAMSRPRARCWPVPARTGASSTS